MKQFNGKINIHFHPSLSLRDGENTVLDKHFKLFWQRLVPVTNLDIRTSRKSLKLGLGLGILGLGLGTWG